MGPLTRPHCSWAILTVADSAPEIQLAQPIVLFLLADVLPDHRFVLPDRGYEISASPEVLADEVATVLSVHPRRILPMWIVQQDLAPRRRRDCRQARPSGSLTAQTATHGAGRRVARCRHARSPDRSMLRGPTLGAGQRRASRSSRVRLPTVAPKRQGNSVPLGTRATLLDDAVVFTRHRPPLVHDRVFHPQLAAPLDRVSL